MQAHLRGLVAQDVPLGVQQQARRVLSSHLCRQLGLGRVQPRAEALAEVIVAQLHLWALLPHAVDRGEHLLEHLQHNTAHIDSHARLQAHTAAQR